MTILFVCVHNAGRSQMAEAILKVHAAKRNIDVTAESAGTIGGREINPMAKIALEEIGISMEGQIPKLLTKEMVERASHIISMGCGVDAEACPTHFLITEDWALDDPAGQELEAVRKIRDQIRAKVDDFLDRVMGKVSSR